MYFIRQVAEACHVSLTPLELRFVLLGLTLEVGCRAAEARYQKDFTAVFGCTFNHGKVLPVSTFYPCFSYENTILNETENMSIPRPLDSSHPHPQMLSGALMIMRQIPLLVRLAPVEQLSAQMKRYYAGT